MNTRWSLGVAVCATSLLACSDEPPVADRPFPVWHDGYANRLVIKFTDEQVARLDGTGKPDLATDEDEGDIRGVLEAHDLHLQPLLRLSEAKFDALEQLAAQPRDFRGVFHAERSEDRDRQLAAAGSFLALSSVELVYFEPLDVPPPGDIEPMTASFVANQSYRGEAGIDAIYAATVGATGRGVRLSDVEYGWAYAHEDLVDRDLHPEPGQTISPDVYSWGFADHGTAVLGETSAVDNAYGVTGLVPDADVFTYSEMTVEGGSRRADAVAAAIAGSRPGDVVLLEMQTPGANGNYGPAEYDPVVWQIVKAGTDAGVIVVAAAGNGNENLDSEGYAEYRARGDSGAIIVGAATADHTKLDFSTHGARVDLHGWGENVVTLGYGDLLRQGSDVNQDYTTTFGGTSSASPMVASACIALQSHAIATRGRALTPREMRDLLVATGTRQADPQNGAIGPLPNLRAALMKLDDMPDMPTEPAPTQSLVINEILADPASGYDASGDGVASSTADEFIELVNIGATPLDLGGATISDAVGVRVTLPAGTVIPSHGVLVVFGGGAVAGLPAGVQGLSLGTLALNNNGDTVTITQGGVVLATATFGAEAGKDQSLVRATEGDPNAAFVRHSTVGSAPASPGTRADGTAL